MVWTWAASAGVGPKAACSRKRRAADAETCGFCTPIGTAKGCETTVPFAAVRFSELAGPPKPDTLINDGLEYTVVRATPFNWATERAVKPVPFTVVENTPRGRGEVPIDEIVGGTLLTSVTVAVDCPLEFFAATVPVPVSPNIRWEI